MKEIVRKSGKGIEYALAFHKQTNNAAENLAKSSSLPGSSITFLIPAHPLVCPDLQFPLHSSTEFPVIIFLFKHPSDFFLVFHYLFFLSILVSYGWESPGSGDWD